MLEQDRISKSSTKAVEVCPANSQNISLEQDTIVKTTISTGSANSKIKCISEIAEQQIVSIETINVDLTTSRVCKAPSLDDKLEAISLLKQHIEDESIHFQKNEISGGDSDLVYANMYLEAEAKVGLRIARKKFIYDSNDRPVAAKYYASKNENNLLYDLNYTYVNNRLVFSQIIRQSDAQFSNKTYVYDGFKLSYIDTANSLGYIPQALTTITINPITLKSWETVIGSSITAEVNKGYFIDTTSSPFTLTLPINPETGDAVGVSDFKNNAGSNNITILRNGTFIDGDDEDLVIDLSKVSFKLVYSDIDTGWTIMDYFQGQ